MSNNLKQLQETIVKCRLCPRLVAFRETVPMRKEFADLPCWRKPVPGFGDPAAKLLIVGLAPSATGGNRTGRIFTGDGTGRFLMHALHKAGFASQPTSISRDDGLVMYNCYLTAVVKCVPPGNKPLGQEVANCNGYLQQELQLLKGLTHVLALGRIAFDTFLGTVGKRPRLSFGHGVRYQIPEGPMLYASYHPSPQNTNTGVLTEEMFLSVLEQIKREISN